MLEDVEYLSLVVTLVGVPVVIILVAGWPLVIFYILFNTNMNKNKVKE